MTRSELWTNLAPENNAGNPRSTLRQLAEKMGAGNSDAEVSYSNPTLEALIHHLHPSAETGEAQIMARLGIEDKAVFDLRLLKLKKAARSLGLSDEDLATLSENLQKSSAREQNA